MDKDLVKKCQDLGIATEELGTEFLEIDVTLSDIIKFCDNLGVLDYDKVNIWTEYDSYDIRLSYSRQRNKEELQKELESLVAYLTEKKEKKRARSKKLREENKQRKSVLAKLSPEERKILGY